MRGRRGEKIARALLLLALLAAVVIAATDRRGQDPTAVPVLPLFGD